MHSVFFNLFQRSTKRHTHKKFKNSFVLCLIFRNKSKLMVPPFCIRFQLPFIKSPKARSESKDWSLISNLSLRHWDKPHTHTHTQSGFVFGQGLICWSGAPELRETARTESRDFKSSQCSPLEKTDDSLFSIRTYQSILVIPLNCYPD